MPVNATPGDAAANSYATEAEYAAYAAGERLPVIASAVLLASDPKVTAGLIVSCRTLEACFEWTGGATNPTIQALGWPRNGMASRTGASIANTVIPQELKNAQMELAYQILGGFDSTADNQALLKGVSAVKAGSVGVNFQSQDSSTRDSVDMLIRRMGSRFNYVSLAIPGEVRRMLLQHWFIQARILRPVIIDIVGSSVGHHRHEDGQRDDL